MGRGPCPATDRIGGGRHVPTLCPTPAVPDTSSAAETTFPNKTTGSWLGSWEGPVSSEAYAPQG